MQEYVFSPHYDFFIDKVHRDCAYNMRTFHFHKKYEIYFQSEGVRRYYIGDSAYLVNAGSVVIINHDSIHKAGSLDNSPHTRFVVNFSREFLLDIQATMPNVDIFACFKTRIAVLPLSPKKQRTIETLLGELWDGNESEGGEAIALRKLQMTALLIYLGRYTTEEQLKEVADGRIINPTIEKIQEYISTHYKEELSLTHIAAQFYISPYYLSRLFKRITNLSIVEYINSVRVMSAKNLLENGRAGISRIAESTGFSTTAHFSRVFRDSTGLSPQKYRKFYTTTKQEQ